MKIKVGVIFGGISVEHEVSIISGTQAISYFDDSKYEIVPIYISKEGFWYTSPLLKKIENYKDLKGLKSKCLEVNLIRKGNQFILQSKGIFKKKIETVDIVFPIMHGTNGEDGGLQGYLNTLGIPYAECDYFASVVGQDKVFMKQIWKDNDVPVVKYEWFYDIDYKKDSESILDRLEKLKYPMIVKPARLGSSIGIKIAKDRDELNDAILEAINYDNKILIEEVVKNLTEVNISVLGDYRKQELSVIEEVGGDTDILTFEDKYIGGGKSKKTPSQKGMVNTKRIIPANIEKELKEKVEDIAVKAFRSLNSSGVVRIDFLIDSKNKKVYANEINSIPGSLSFYLWEKTNKSYKELLSDVLNIAVHNHKLKESKTYAFDSNILKDFNGTKGIKK